MKYRIEARKKKPKKPNPKKSRCWLVHLIAAMFSALIIGVPLVMLLDRRPPITIDEFKVVWPIDGMVVAGKDFQIQWRVHQERNACHGEVLREIIASDLVHRFILDPSFVDHQLPGGIGEKVFVEKWIHAPAGMAAGRGWYHVRITYWCNVFQEYLWPIIVEKSEPLIIR